MTTQQAEGGGAGTEETSGQSGEAGQAPSAQELVARITELESRLGKSEHLNKKYSDEAAKYRKIKDEEKGRAEAAAIEKGEFKSLFEQTRAQLTAAEEKAARWDAFEEGASARLAKEAKDLPGYLQRAIEAAPDVMTRLEIVDAYRAESAKGSDVTPVQTGSPAPSSPATAPYGQLNPEQKKAERDRIRKLAGGGSFRLFRD